jgi:hypothetical protein
MSKNMITNQKLRSGVLVGVLMAVGTTVTAGAPGREKPASSAAQLAARQKQIESLQQRIQLLELRLNRMTAYAVPTALSALTTSSSSPVSQAEPQASDTPTAEAPQGDAAAAGGQQAGTFVVDEAAAQRALERTLTQTGALLLPVNIIEVTPTLLYSLTERTSAVLATVTVPGTPSSSLAVVNSRLRSNETLAAVSLRVGLRGQMQAEANIPFSHIDASRIDDFGNAEAADGNGTGDISVGIARTFLQEAGWMPDLVGRLTYNFGNGRQQQGILGFGGGFRQVQGEVVALKRQDPLAFTASAFYSRVFERDAFKPGDARGFSLGAALAVSPATSLQFNFSQIWRKRQESAGVKVAGTDQAYGIFALGASSVLSRDITLVTQVGIGLGSEAPSYTASISLPILFR